MSQAVDILESIAQTRRAKAVSAAVVPAEAVPLKTAETGSEVRALRPPGLPWYGNVAIAAGMLVVPVLLGLASWRAQPGLIAGPASAVASPTATTRVPADHETVEHAQLRLTPI